MKTEMRKNNKMFLALVVVAALAAVSFAGIALSDDSDAALISNNVVIQPGETQTIDYNFYVSEGDFFKVFEFEVKTTGSYTGTISLGVANADRSVYDSYSSLKLTNASSVRITGIMFNSAITGGVVTFFMIGNLDQELSGVLPTGTYELTKGQIVLGALKDVSDADWATMAANALSLNINVSFGGLGTFMQNQVTAGNATSFCGTVTAGTLSVKSSYTIGTMIGIPSAGSPRISSLFITAAPDVILPFDVDKVTGDPAHYPEYKDRTLSISGTASLQYPEAFQLYMDKNIGAAGPGLIDYMSDRFSTGRVNVVIEENAVITAGDREPTVADNVKIDAGSPVIFAYLVSDAQAYMGTVAIAAPWFAEFGDVPLGIYTLILGDVGGNVYYGNVTISGSGDNYSMSIGPNQLSNSFIPAGGAPNGLVLDGLGQVTYTPANYGQFIFALNLTNNEVGKLRMSSGAAVDGEIEFPTPAVAGDDVFVVLRAAVGGAPMRCYYGPADGSSNAASALAKIRTNSAPLAADEIKAGTVAVSSTIVSYIAQVDSNILVKGRMNFLYNTISNYAILDLGTGDAYLDFDGTGIIAHGVAPMVSPSLPADMFSGATSYERISAAYFYVNEPATGTVTKSTYYFTTLENALTLNGDITLNGKHVILKDTTLSNPAFPSIKVTLGEGAILEVGKVKDSDSDAKSAILTIPSTTTIIVPSYAIPCHYDVINGQAVYDVKPVPSAYEPGADVLITRTSPTKFIYTDIGTGLDISISGDVLTLRQNASLFRDATVKDGVTLKDSSAGNLTIEEEVILTVNGTVESEYAMDIKGTLRINKIMNISRVGAAAVLSGTIEVTSNGVLNLKNNASITGDPAITDGVIDIAGQVNLENTSNVNVGTLILTGKLNVATGAIFTVNTLLQIGAKPTLSPMSTPAYSNTAAITGKVTLATTVVAYVYGNFTFTATGAGAKADVGGGTLAKTEYQIDGNLYLTVYCNGLLNQPIPMLYERQLLDIKISDWNNEAYLAGSNLSSSSVSAPPVAGEPTIGDNDWKVVYANWEWKTYKVVFHYVQGMRWVSNGLDHNGGAEVFYNYGTEIRVNGAVQPGYDGTPSLTVNNATYTAGSPYVVKSDAEFKATNVKTASAATNDGLTLIEILLIIIVIIIAVIAIIVAIRLLRS